MTNAFTHVELNILQNSTTPPKALFPFVALFLLLLIIYANSLSGAWQFDDISNILSNPSVHLSSLDGESVQQTFYGLDRGRISRPVAYLSFGLNHYLGGLDPLGYHVVNLVIHYLAAIFLFLFVYKTLILPRVWETYGPNAYPIALLSATLWAINPVQVSAVTYIVQRMASMAGLFYILSMYLYLLGRTSEVRGRKILFFSLCALSAALAIGTKENAVMIPVSIYLYDLILIQDVSRKILVKHLKYFILPAAILVSLWLFFSLNILSIVDGYAGRPFTLTERLLTEPRVILFYISLLLYPTYSRLMLNHDVELSTSFLDPWTTLPAILAIAVCIGWAVWVARKNPLPAYCILFFFLNHFIEGSFIPLELIYEHRNYIPSMLLFLPVAIFIVRALEYFSYKKILQFSIAALVSFVLAAQGHTVSMYNHIFKDTYSLWSDNVIKAPNLSRPYIGLGNALWDQERFEEAYAAYETAWGLNRFQRSANAHSAIYNMGRYHFLIGDNERALAFFKAAIKIEPKYEDTWISLTRTLIRLDNLNGAEMAIRLALAHKPDSMKLNATLSFVLLKKKAYPEALQTAWETMTLHPECQDLHRVLAEAYRRNHHLDRAIHLLETYVMNNRNDTESNLALIELYTRTGQTEKLDRTIARVMMLKGPQSWRALIADFQNGKADHAYEPDSQRLLSMIRTRLNQQQ
jgi:tetratricopeptide (TPR) repeat protein